MSEDDGWDESGWFDAATATLGDRIAGAREAAGMSPAQFARALGVKLTTVQSWEDDRAEPRANKLQMAAGMLNVSVGWLLTGSGDGLDGPPVEARVDRTQGAEARAALGELKRLREEMGAMSRRLGRTEARLAALLKAGA